MTWSNWLVKLGILCICLDVVIIVTLWYFVKIVKPRFPDWWQRVVVDEEPHDH